MHTAIAKLVAMLCLHIVALGVSPAWAADAIQTSKQRGVDPTTAFKAGEYDSVNALNGNLSVVIPLGQAYEFVSGFAYRFYLTYNSNAWDHVIRAGSDSDELLNTPIDVGLGVPMGDSNAGLGWRVSLGDLYPPLPNRALTSDEFNSLKVWVNETHRWLFVAPDGGRHYFYETPHPDSTAGGAASVLYTSDGSYLRMRVANPRKRVVDFPNGTRYIFECPVGASSGHPDEDDCWRLTRMEDSYAREGVGNSGNWVNLNHEPSGIAISDSLGRNHRINLRTTVAPQAFFPRVVASVDLAAPQGRRAIYALNTEERAIARGCARGFPTVRRFINSNGNWSAPISPLVSVPLLRKLTLPDSSSFSFTVLESTMPSSLFDDDCLRGNGRLEEMVDSLGKRTAWSYRTWAYPNADCTYPIQGGPNFPPEDGGIDPHLPQAPVWEGVGERREYPGGPLGEAPSRWRYFPEWSMETLQPALPEHPRDVCPIVTRQLATSVIDPHGLVEVNYFSLYREDKFWDSTAYPNHGSPRAGSELWTNTEFGRPLSRYRSRLGMATDVLSPGQQTVHISKEVWSCPAGHTPAYPTEFVADANIDVPFAVQHSQCMLLRQVYRADEHDPIGVGLPAANDLGPDESPTDFHCLSAIIGDFGLRKRVPCSDINWRTAELITIYKDDQDRYTSTRSGNYDGFGNFRTQVQDSNIASITPTVTRQEYNPGRDRLDIPAPGQPWLLQLYASRSTQAEGGVVHTDYCFDDGNGFATGFLKRSRAYKSLNGAPNANDVVTEYLPRTVVAGDPGSAPLNGEVLLQQFFGGDLQTVTSGGCEQDITPSPAEFSFKPRYAHGEVAQVDLVSPASMDSVLLRGDIAEIDQNSGLVVRATDQSGVATTAAYDIMGRTMESTTPGVGTSTYTYCLATQAARPPTCAGFSADSNIVTAVAVDAGGQELSQRTYLFDAAARVVEEREKLASDSNSSTTRRRLNRYDSAGLMREQTPWSQNPNLGSPNNYAWLYDNLKRPYRVTNPDGSVTEYDYAGDRRVSTRVRMATGENGVEAESLSTVFYDNYRRPVEVREYATTEVDAQGNRVPTLIAHYEYDATGGLEMVTACQRNCGGSSVKQERHFAHDGLGRMVSARIPEQRTNDGTPVLTLYEKYNTLGSVGVERLSDQSRRTHHVYDYAGRLIRSFDGNPAASGSAKGRILAEYQYGVGNIGGDLRQDKLVGAKRHNYVPIDPANPSAGTHDWVVRESYSYEHPAGLMTKLSTKASRLTTGLDATGARVLGSVHASTGLTFETTVAYAANGAPGVIGYPQCSAASCSAATLPNRSIAYGYRLGTLTEVRANSVTGPLLTQLAYHPNGMTKSVRHFNSGAVTATESLDVDPSGMLRATNFTLSRGGTQLWTSGEIRYDSAGNLRQVGTDQYTYDLMGRLKTARTLGAAQQASYDAFGNLLSLTTGATTRNIAVDSASNRLVAGNDAYNSAGSVTRWQGRTIGYDNSERVSYLSWKDGTGVGVRKGYVYSPSGRRVALVDFTTGEEVWTLGSTTGRAIREVRRTSASGMEWLRDYVPAAKRLVTSFERVPGSGERERRYHTDHLGSTRAVTDASGNLVAQYAFHPFGQTALSSGPEAADRRRLFTGHERDHHAPTLDDDMDYMGARYYIPSFGRFLSVDPVQGSATSPQSWNRYAYVLNNPMRFNDPTGAACENPEAASEGDPACVNHGDAVERKRTAQQLQQRAVESEQPDKDAAPCPACLYERRAELAEIRREAIANGSQNDPARPSQPTFGVSMDQKTGQVVPNVPITDAEANVALFLAAIGDNGPVGSQVKLLSNYLSDGKRDRLVDEQAPAYVAGSVVGYADAILLFILSSRTAGSPPTPPPGGPRPPPKPLLYGPDGKPVVFE
jgi:RHS repeat-associated protein